jgi:hypothetical protein
MIRTSDWSASTLGFVRKKNPREMWNREREDIIVGPDIRPILQDLQLECMSLKERDLILLGLDVLDKGKFMVKDQHGTQRADGALQSLKRLGVTVSPRSEKLVQGLPLIL